MGKHLLIACAVGDLQWLQLCVEKGADPTFVNNEGWSALHMAAMNAKLNCLQFLIDNLKIDVDITSETGWTPLHLASRAKPETDALDCVTFLLNEGADVNRANEMGITSVHQAVSANNLKCLSTLVKNGARVACTDKRGLQPIDVAKVWGHSECSKYLENVMWYEKKREEESTRRRWVLEHKKLLDEEIKKYADAKRSDKVHHAYKSWIDKKKLGSPKLPSHSEARARPLTCYKEEVIHDFHRKQLSKKIQEKVSSPRPRQFSPRLQLERVKKIQELRNTITSRDIMGQSRDESPVKSRDVPKKTRDVTIKSRDVAIKSRDVTIKTRDVTLEPNKVVSNSTVTAPAPRGIDNITRPSVKSPEELKPGIKLSTKSKEDEYYHQYRISKLAEPKQPCNRRKRRKKKSLKTSPEEPLYYPVRIDNYFSPSSSTPDSGYVEEPVSPPPEETDSLKVDEFNELDIVSVDSEESQIPEKLVKEASIVDVGNKSVRFSENVFYDTEHNSVSFGNTFEHLRSCIKAKNIH
ncbi:synphilin-1-like [Bolinopsis microptera]|uniref:synphilin-1-like n=1 Tax=Bolinopsis microptera TaxID=2820187 RepID=UPI00307A5FD3